MLFKSLLVFGFVALIYAETPDEHYWATHPNADKDYYQNVDLTQLKDGVGTRMMPPIKAREVILDEISDTHPLVDKTEHRDIAKTESDEGKMSTNERVRRQVDFHEIIKNAEAHIDRLRGPQGRQADDTDAKRFMMRLPRQSPVQDRRPQGQDIDRHPDDFSHEQSFHESDKKQDRDRVTPLSGGANMRPPIPGGAGVGDLLGGISNIADGAGQLPGGILGSIANAGMPLLNILQALPDAVRPFMSNMPVPGRPGGIRDEHIGTENRPNSKFEDVTDRQHQDIQRQPDDLNKAEKSTQQKHKQIPRMVRPVLTEEDMAGDRNRRQWEGPEGRQMTSEQVLNSEGFQRGYHRRQPVVTVENHDQAEKDDDHKVDEQKSRVPKDTEGKVHHQDKDEKMDLNDELKQQNKNDSHQIPKELETGSRPL